MKIDSKQIEIYMAMQDITKTDLSERCRISRQNLSTIIRRGTCEPKTAGKIARGLGVSVSEILAKEGA